MVMVNCVEDYGCLDSVHYQSTKTVSKYHGIPSSLGQPAGIVLAHISMTFIIMFREKVPVPMRQSPMVLQLSWRTAQAADYHFSKIASEQVLIKFPVEQHRPEARMFYTAYNDILYAVRRNVVPDFLISDAFF
jgi:hypothetical protein